MVTLALSKREVLKILFPALVRVVTFHADNNLASDWRHICHYTQRSILPQISLFICKVICIRHRKRPMIGDGSGRICALRDRK